MRSLYWNYEIHLNTCNIRATGMK